MREVKWGEESERVSNVGGDYGGTIGTAPPSLPKREEINLEKQQIIDNKTAETDYSQHIRIPTDY
ncbi:hypothetical protein N1030_11170 [Desulfovibrio mangrovi]|uniref:hypothetical protein n=1 Tax=Desulfovibrio mangrovi TaxID=2976983 RepID=UPI0022470A1F|nr:hypothetical protein [Desulfovibrio mangrovi]UZP66182.1 hypothetical protein N1030_11170 [Desulfovibrio mangrovi]